MTRIIGLEEHMATPTYSPPDEYTTRTSTNR